VSFVCAGSGFELRWPPCASAAGAFVRDCSSRPGMSVSSSFGEKPKFRDTLCGHIVGLLLICYGLFNTFLFVKFTPVYTATQCGQQEATLQKFSLGSTISVGLQIQVTCWNPNSYQVSIMASEPGHVWVGENRNFSVGLLSVMQGSYLPQSGTGDIQVHMDAEVSPQTSQQLVPKFLSDHEIPMYLELQFEVGVSLNFGLMSFGTTAPFKKKCGMNLAGLLKNTATRLGPMICRESFYELSELPHVGEATVGTMSFSGAQMDPDRIAMGEMAKNVSIISVGGLCYFFGIWLTYHWINGACAAPPAPPPPKPRSMLALQPSCFRGTSGNLADAGRTVVKPNGYFGYFGSAQQGHLLDVEGSGVYATTMPQSNCLTFGPVINFLSCGVMGGKRQPPPPATSRPMYYQPSCVRATSGNTADFPR